MKVSDLIGKTISKIVPVDQPSEDHSIGDWMNIYFTDGTVCLVMSEMEAQKKLDVNWISKVEIES